MTASSERSGAAKASTALGGESVRTGTGIGDGAGNRGGGADDPIRPAMGGGGAKACNPGGAGRDETRGGGGGSVETAFDRGTGGATARTGGADDRLRGKGGGTERLTGAGTGVEA